MFTLYFLATIIGTELAKITSKFNEEFELYKSQMDEDSSVTESPLYETNKALIVQLHEWYKDILQSLHKHRDDDIRLDWLVKAVSWIDVSPKSYLQYRYLGVLSKLIYYRQFQNC